MAGRGDLVATLGDDPGLVVEVAVGHEGWRSGEITLALGGESAASVRRRRSGEEREWHRRVDPDQLRALGRRLSALGLERIVPGRASGDPDDDPVRLTVRRNGTALHDVRLRHSQRFEDARLDGILDEWEHVVEDVTAGELPYGESG